MQGSTVKPTSLTAPLATAPGAHSA